MKKLQPVVLLAALALALAGAILLTRNGLSTPPIVMLIVGLIVSLSIGLRATSRGIDPQEHSAAIRQRAQANWDAAKRKDA